MEQHDAGVVQGNERNDDPKANTATKFGSGLHESNVYYGEPAEGCTSFESSKIEPTGVGSSESKTIAELPAAPEQQAFVGADGQIHQVPPELIGPDGKMLPFNEKTMRKLRGKYFSVEHPWLEDCGHRLDMINFPKRNCQNCLFQWFNCHAKLVETAHEFYQQYGKERLIALRGQKFVKAFLMFMSTVHHFLEEQKKEEQDGKTGEVQNAGNSR